MQDTGEVKVPNQILLWVSSKIGASICGAKKKPREGAALSSNREASNRVDRNHSKHSAETE
jgi:hypothetical protein